MIEIIVGIVYLLGMCITIELIIIKWMEDIRKFKN